MIAFRRFVETPSASFFGAAILLILAGTFAIPATVGRPRLNEDGSQMSGPDGEILTEPDLWATFCLNWQSNLLLIAALVLAGWALFLLVRKVCAR